MAELLVATESFWTEVNGEDKLFLKGSKLPATHPVAKRAAPYFEPVEPEPPPAKTRSA